MTCFKGPVDAVGAYELYVATIRGLLRLVTSSNGLLRTETVEKVSLADQVFYYSHFFKSLVSVAPGMNTMRISVTHRFVRDYTLEFRA